MVVMNLDLGQQLHQFDYTDTFKNHSGVLCWLAGNEMAKK
jgi:hypothetical protein